MTKISVEDEEEVVVQWFGKAIGGVDDYCIRIRGPKEAKDLAHSRDVIANLRLQNNQMYGQLRSMEYPHMVATDELKKYLREIVREAAENKSHVNWQPIETAPKFAGSTLLIWLAAGYAVGARWGSEGWEEIRSGIKLELPTHWIHVSGPDIP